ncbi:MAG: hypothetical protein AAFN74_07505, partial [Myxococcota bacterium]
RSDDTDSSGAWGRPRTDSTSRPVALVSAQLQAIRAKIQARIAVVRLDNATGRDVESVLGRPHAPLESVSSDR